MNTHENPIHFLRTLSSAPQGLDTNLALVEVADRIAELVDATAEEYRAKSAYRGAVDRDYRKDLWNNIAAARERRWKAFRAMQSPVQGGTTA